MSMKRSREDDREVEALAVAKCLMLLSQIGESTTATTSPAADGRVFECKTCNRQFPSFQALGGHRASHKKPKLMAGDLLHQLPAEPKTHECSICGVEFALGQALGGHMRRHRAAMESSIKSNSTSNNSMNAAPVPFLTRSNSSKRVSCLDLNLNLNLNLNLMPYDIDLKLGW